MSFFKKIKYSFARLFVVFVIVAMPLLAQETTIPEDNEVDKPLETAKEVAQTNAEAEAEVEVLPLQKVYSPNISSNASPNWLSEIKPTDVETQFMNLPMPKELEIFRRAEAVMLISVPFSIFYTYLMKSSFKFISAMGGGMEGGGTGVLPQNFSYSHNYFLEQTVDPFYIFTWVNNVIWPFTIAINNVIDRNAPKSYVEKKRKNIPKNRFGDDLMLFRF